MFFNFPVFHYFQKFYEFQTVKNLNKKSTRNNFTQIYYTVIEILCLSSAKIHILE